MWNPPDFRQSLKNLYHGGDLALYSNVSTISRELALG